MRDINDLQQGAPSNERKKLEENVRNRFLTDLHLLTDKHRALYSSALNIEVMKESNCGVLLFKRTSQSSWLPIQKMSLGTLIYLVEQFKD